MTAMRGAEALGAVDLFVVHTRNMLAFITSTLLLWLPAHNAARCHACGFVFKRARSVHGQQGRESCHKRSCTPAVKSECSHSIVSLPLTIPALPLAPSLLRALPWQRQLSAQAGCIHPSPWTMVVLPKLPISLSDRLERRRRLCEYILINRNGRALGGDREVRLRENWQKIWCREGRLRK